MLAAEVNVSIAVTEEILFNIQKRKNNAVIDFSIVSSIDENKDKNPINSLDEKHAFNYMNVLFNHFFINKILDSPANEPFIITSERTGISLFQKEIDGNRSNIVDSYMTRRATSRIKRGVISFDDIMNRKVASFSEPINHNLNIIRDFTDTRKLTQLSRRINFRKNTKKELSLIF